MSGGRSRRWLPTPDNHTVSRLALSLWLLLVAAGGLSAATEDGRVIHRFDFEERDDGNFEDLPMFFERSEGVGMPHWAGGRLVIDRARSGQHSFRLDINGGSSAYRVGRRVLEAVPQARYRIDAYVSTTQLEFARARINVFFMDEAGEVLSTSMRQSVPVASPGGADGWIPISVEAYSEDPEVKWIGFELGLLQPGAGGVDAGGRVEDDALLRFRQDVRGSAWFDDVTVSRIPQIRVSESGRAGIFSAKAPVVLELEVVDARASDLQSFGRAFDASGKEVWAQPGHASRIRIADSRAEIIYSFSMGVLPPGVYTAVLRVSGAGTQSLDGVATATHRTRFAVLADTPTESVADPRFTIDAAHLAEADWPQLVAMLRPIGVGRVAVAVWGGPGQNDVGQNTDGFSALTSGLSELGIKLTAVFDGPTPSIAEAAGGDGWLLLVDAITHNEPAATTWRSALGFLVSRHAHMIDRWQVGTVADADRFASDAQLRRTHQYFFEVIASLVSQPVLAMPWPARQAIRLDPQPDAFELHIGSNVPPRQLPLYIADATSVGTGSEVSLHLDWLDPEKYGREEVLSDTVQRVTLALAGGADRLTLPLPYHLSTETGFAEPTESYVVLRTLLNAIGGRAYQGRVPAGDVDDRVEAYLFADPDDAAGVGTLVIWGESSKASGGRSTLKMNLGSGAEQVDLWGNRRPLRQDAGGFRDGVADVAVGVVPSIITGVDAPLTRLRQTVRLDNPMIESSFRPHPRQLMLTNTFNRQISGTIRVGSPTGWRAELLARSFSLNPGETLSRSIDLHIPYNSDAGQHRLDVRILLSGGKPAADGRPGVVEVHVPLEVQLGLAEVGLRTLARRENGDLLVEQTITNYGDTPVHYDAFVLVPGRSRQERLVVDLGPGREAVRRYLFRGAGELPAGSELLSGLREMEGTRVLNDRVDF